jgi:hypothetical protein
MTKTQFDHKQLLLYGQLSQTTTVCDRYVLCHPRGSVVKHTDLILEGKQEES